MEKRFTKIPSFRKPFSEIGRTSAPSGTLFAEIRASSVFSEATSVAPLFLRSVLRPFIWSSCSWVIKTAESLFMLPPTRSIASEIPFYLTHWLLYNNLLFGKGLQTKNADTFGIKCT